MIKINVGKGENYFKNVSGKEKQKREQEILKANRGEKKSVGKQEQKETINKKGN